MKSNPIEYLGLQASLLLAANSIIKQKEIQGFLEALGDSGLLKQCEVEQDNSCKFPDYPYLQQQSGKGEHPISANIAGGRLKSRLRQPPFARSPDLGRRGATEVAFSQRILM